jgi:enamine deaminase RidA (YjgF/YER057c/UK114 family)
MTDENTAAPATVLPEGWKRGSGFAHAVVDPATGLVIVAGQFGQDPRTGELAPDFASQWQRALENIVEVAKHFGRGPDAIMLLRIFIRSLDEYSAARAEVGAAQKAVLGKWYPATTMVEVSGLVEPKARLEIEAVLAVRAKQHVGS